MTIVGEVVEALKMAATAVSSTRTLLEAAGSSRAYLIAKKPQAAADFKLLLEEMGKTVRGTAEVCAVITDFDFTVEGAELDRQPDRFNDYVIASRKELYELKNGPDIRSHCEKIRQHQEALAHSADAQWWDYYLPGAAARRDRAAELADRFDNLYRLDLNIAEIINRMLAAAHQTLTKVSEELARDKPGPSPQNVVPARALLKEYAADFKKVQVPAQQLVGAFRLEIATLS